ncbi:MAG TPA: DUF4132 domain-containing protein [Pyrinomonadaceae bacterium]
MFLLKPPIEEPYDSLIAELTAEEISGYFYYYALKDSPAGQKLLEASADEQRGFVLAAAAWLDRQEGSMFDNALWRIRTAMLTLLRRRIPFEHDDVARLLEWSALQTSINHSGIPQMIKAVDDYLKEHELTPALTEKIAQLVARIESGHSTAESRKWVVRLKELGGQTALSIPLVAGEAWSDAVIQALESFDGEHRNAWLSLFNLCSKANGSTPTAKWLKAAEPLLETISFAFFKEAMLEWFPLVDKPRTERIEFWPEYQPDPNNIIVPVNADILRALVWLCSLREDKEIARALSALAVSAYRKVPGVGPRCVRVGNACIWALGSMPGTEAVGQLALLKVKVKFGTAQRGIETALAAAARRAGLPQDEIEEISVPTYGLQEVGRGREPLSDYAAELTVTGTNDAEIKWAKPDGKRQTSVPQAVKDQHPEELKNLKQTLKDICKMLPAQAARIENLYLERKKWAFPAWRERYLDHPLVGTLARRLIWKFTCGPSVASGIWYEGRIVGADECELDWLNDATEVELWHPIEEAPETVIRWREWLTEHEVRQPFKQAHREVYLLTDAERSTRLYSNRFAAHIIKQHQFNALCAARNWKNKLRLMVDDEYPPAVRPTPAWNLRVEFWVEGAGENYGTDTNEAGTYLYLTTDQVRFYPLDSAMNYAHAGGGGYHSAIYGQVTPAEPLSLEQIPPLVFSEIMRDVDMFVGVASVANDPGWADGGPEGRYQAYWANYSFGDLSETAKTRRAVLERLVPRLKIADRCRLTDKFLMVRGDLRTYKIHLGSGNIMMEPNDQYLCIVPARGMAADSGHAGKVFLPFEGDNTLAIILSKAFLLAEDTKITDPTIVRQIGG